MAKREGLIYKFFEKWKDRKLNSLAKRVIKQNPEFVKALKDLDDAFGDLEKEFSKNKNKLK
tara:strand:+ start:193 stop:375 length:183 start_codon:yes stop_codon:yes gene_type:complete